MASKTLKTFTEMSQEVAKEKTDKLDQIFAKIEKSKKKLKKMRALLDANTKENEQIDVSVNISIQKNEAIKQQYAEKDDVEGIEEQYQDAMDEVKEM